MSEHFPLAFKKPSYQYVNRLCIVDACLPVITADLKKEKCKPSFIPNSAMGSHSRKDQKSIPVPTHTHKYS